MPHELTTINYSYWILQTIAMMITALLIPGLRVSGPLGAFIGVIGLAFVNSKVWDAALFLSLPNHISTQVGLLILTNGVIFWIIVKILPGIEVTGVLPALVAPLVFSVCSMAIDRYGKDIDWVKVGKVALLEIEELRDHFIAVADESQTPAKATPTPAPHKTK